MRYFKIHWNRKGQKRVEEEERLVNTSRMREKRRKAQETSTVNFGLWNGLCELSIYRENSQLKSEKLWEQVINLVQKYLDCVPKYIILSTKIYNLVHKCII